VWSIPHPAGTSVVRTSEAGTSDADPSPGCGSAVRAWAMSSDAIAWLDTAPEWPISTAPVPASPCIAKTPPITATASTARVIQAR
jgi:hypothetical protein